MRSSGFALVVTAMCIGTSGALAQYWLPHYSNDPCDPSYSGYHGNQVTASLAQQACDNKRRQEQQAQIEEQQRQQYRQRVEEAADLQRRAEQAAARRGYTPVHDVKDLILDGKMLAANNAKIQISGFYRKIGDAEFLYGSAGDAYQGNNNFISILTDGAQRDLRKHFLNYSCSLPEIGCQIDVGGHMTMCRNLSPEAENYPNEPCLNVEVEIVYRPGD